MNTTQINCALKSNRIFRGVFARDQLENVSLDRYPIAFVVNTDKSSGPGEHWVAIFIDQNGRGYYFDSYGRPPLKEIDQF